MPPSVNHHTQNAEVISLVRFLMLDSCPINVMRSVCDVRASDTGTRALMYLHRTISKWEKLYARFNRSSDVVSHWMLARDS